MPQSIDPDYGMNRVKANMLIVMDYQLQLAELDIDNPESKGRMLLEVTLSVVMSLNFFFCCLKYVALELLCSIPTFAGFEKRGLKVVGLYFASFYFCILTAGFVAHRIPNSS